MDEFVSPAELFERKPELREKIKRSQQVGWLISLGLVKGRKVGHTCLVSFDDVCKLYSI